MIELVAHKDNSWPGAFRLMMKDTGFLLGIGRDVVAVAKARLVEEGFDDGFYLVTFADGRTSIMGEYPVKRAVGHIDPVTREYVERAEPETPSPEPFFVEPKMKDAAGKVADPWAAAAEDYKRRAIAAGWEPLDKTTVPQFENTTLPRFQNTTAPKPFFDKPKESFPVGASKPKDKRKPKADTVEKFTLPELKPVAPKKPAAKKKR